MEGGAGGDRDVAYWSLYETSPQRPGGGPGGVPGGGVGVILQFLVEGPSGKSRAERQQQQRLQGQLWLPLPLLAENNTILRVNKNTAK